MRALFDIRSSASTYRVASQANVFANALADPGNSVLLVDDYFATRPELAGRPTIPLSSGETSKSFDNIGGIIVRMRELGVRRNTRLWAIGGGTIQDVAGFLASIYMRGLSWSYVPTTLLGMVDSCIGGKSSINVGDYKNIVGTFHPPELIVIDPMLTATLGAEQRVAGLAEAAKICYCRGADAFSSYLALDPGVDMGPAEMERVITLSLESKKWFVEIDEFDRAERLVLNLGHTFGHALEAASHYRLSHGVGVGVGILCALRMSASLLGVRPGGPAAALETHMLGLLRELPELADSLAPIDLAVALDRLRSDKKHESAAYRFVLFDASGTVELHRLPKSTDLDACIVAAIRQVLGDLS